MKFTMLSKAQRWLGLALSLLLVVGGVLGMRYFSRDVAGAPASDTPFGERGERVQFTLDLPQNEPIGIRQITPSATATGWQSIATESFDDYILESPWSVLPETGQRWGVADINAVEYSNHAAWVRGANQRPTFEDATETYTDSMDTWLVYGPIEGVDLYDVKVTFDYFNRSEAGDYFHIGYSTDGTHFTGFQTSGLLENWQSSAIVWETNQAPQVWIAFGFTSNDDGNVNRGTWVDNIEIQGYYGSSIHLPLVFNQYGEVVQTFSDDFSDPESGWPQTTFEHSDGTDFMLAGYTDATYRMKVILNVNDRNNYRMGLVEAPSDISLSTYDVSVEHFFEKPYDLPEDITPEQGKAGLIFSASDDLSTVYAFEWNLRGDCAVNKYTGVDIPISNLAPGSDEVDTHSIFSWRDCSAYGIPDLSYRTNIKVQVEVEDGTARVYVIRNSNKRLVTQFTDSTLNSENVGLITGAHRYTPFESRFDNFELKP
jgi:hypothetical protein